MAHMCTIGNNQINALENSENYIFCDLVCVRSQKLLNACLMSHEKKTLLSGVEIYACRKDKQE